MAWYLGFFGLVVIALFFGGVYMTNLTSREKEDPELHKKLQAIRKRLNPIMTFFDNLVGWGLAIAVIYFIFLR